MQKIDENLEWTIELQNLVLGYGERVVLKDINATIPSGEITAVLGESGCGKSTLLRHVIGLSKPMSGKILYGGNDLFSLPSKQFRRVRRRFGVLFQDGALLGSLTLAENVGLPLSENTNLSKKTIRNAVLRTLDLVGLADFADFYPNELSGGMRKRGGLARAIVTEPPVLFCDEPTSGLDPINSAQMDRLLLNMKAQFPKMTIVSVTHDLASVANIADKVLVIREGKNVFFGTYQELLNSDNEYLKSFIDRKSENLSYSLPPADESVREALAKWMAQ